MSTVKGSCIRLIVTVAHVVWGSGFRALKKEHVHRHGLKTSWEFLR